jgi:hypothetical protein
MPSLTLRPEFRSTATIVNVRCMPSTCPERQNRRPTQRDDYSLLDRTGCKEWDQLPGCARLTRLRWVSPSPGYALAWL